MQPNQQSRNRHIYVALFFLIAAVTIILLFASGLSTVTLRPGGSLNVFAALLSQASPQGIAPPSTSALTSVVSGKPLLDLLRAFFWVLLPLALIYAFVSPRFRRQLMRTAIFVIALLFAFNRLREMMSPSGEEETLEGVAQSAPPAAANATLPQPPAIVTSTPQWIVWTINLLVALLVILLLWFLWRRLRPESDGDNVQEQVAQQAEAALYALEEGGDLRDVILRCYAQMSTVLKKDNNVQRHAAMTARDFEAHLAWRGFDDEHIRRLTRLFEAARYSAGIPGQEEEEEAIACLTAIVRTYGRQQDSVADRAAVNRRQIDREAAVSSP
jgi:hypothetical protein